VYGWESLPTPLVAKQLPSKATPGGAIAQSCPTQPNKLGGQNGNEKLALTKSVSQLGSWKGANRVSGDHGVAGRE